MKSLAYGIAGGFIGGFLGGFATGLLVAPVTGRRLRSLTRDKVYSVSKSIQDVSGSKMRHMRNVSQGIAARASKIQERLHIPNRNQPIEEPVEMQQLVG